MLRDFLDALLAKGAWFLPFTVVTAYEGAVVLRLGKQHRTLGPGFHWRWPGIEKVEREIVVTRVENLNAQSLTTKDDVTVVVGAVVTLSITDIAAALLLVTSVRAAVRDACLGEIAAHVRENEWAALHDASLLRSLTTRCRNLVKDFGIRIERVRLSDIARSRVLRLHIDQNNAYNQPDLTDET